MARWIFCTYCWLDTLSKPWWQGVAGIAQILAAAISIYLIWLAFKERRESVEPDWEVNPRHKEGITSLPLGIPYWNAYFINTGWGPALNIETWYKNYKTGQKITLPPGPHMVLSGDELDIYLAFKGPEPPDGEIIITSQSRLHKSITCRFAFAPGTDGSSDVTMVKIQSK
jgi:hypothetical protein